MDVLYFTRNWEFGSAFQNFGISGWGGEIEPHQTLPLSTSLLTSFNVLVLYCLRLYLEMTHPYCWGVANRIVIHRLTKMNPRNAAVISTVWQVGNLFCKKYKPYRKTAVSIPIGVIGIFHEYNPSDRTMFLGSTQPLTEMTTRNNSWKVKTASA
jgi:sorbitol-specific phosphotransferase system component IIC